jgi:hypothetical protein
MKSSALAVLVVMAATGAAPQANAAASLPPPAAFCLDHPAACGHCPNCAKGQLDITIANTAGEKTCIANGGTIVMNMSGNKICGGHYMRRTPAAPANSGQPSP